MKKTKKKQKANYREGITWSEIGMLNIQMAKEKELPVTENEQLKFCELGLLGYESAKSLLHTIYFAIILRGRAVYNMIYNQQGAKRRFSYDHFLSSKPE